MMKKILMLTYTVCAMVIITGSLLWFVFTLRSDSQAGKVHALKNFKLFTNRTADILYDPVLQNDPRQAEKTLEQLCHSYHTHINAVLIRNEKGLIFNWPSDSTLFMYKEPNTVEVKNVPIFFSTAQTTIPQRQQQPAITIHAVLQTLPVHIVFNRGQIVFILILILFITTVILLVLSYINPKPIFEKHSTRQPDNQRNTEYSEPDTKMDHNDNNNEDMQVEKKPVQSKNNIAAQLESLNHLHIYETNDNQIDTTVSLEARPQKYHPTQETAASHALNAEAYGSFENCIQSIPEEESGGNKNNIPIGNISEAETLSAELPHGEQTKLIEDLTKAISETAIAEEDLTLLFIRIKGLIHDERILHAIKAQPDRMHNDRMHKIYFFTDDTIGLVIYYAALDKGMQIASTLYEAIHPLVTSNNSSSQLGFGLTTRAGRLIPAYRMIEEASAAVDKAVKNDADPIVAFRVNPEQYRRCIARLH